MGENQVLKDFSAVIPEGENHLYHGAFRKGEDDPAEYPAGFGIL